MAFKGELDKEALKQAEAAAATNPQPRGVVREPSKEHPLLNLSKMRYSLITEQHPNPRAIFLGLDVTGSTTQAHKEMTTGGTTHFLDVLLSLGAQGGFNPQVLFSGIADRTDSAGPLQVGHFEVDMRMYEQLSQITIGGGGGSAPHHEAGYLWALFFLAYKTEPECFTKQGIKGHAIIVGDEFPNKTFTVAEGRVFGVELSRDLTFAEIVEKVRERYHLTFVSLQTDTGKRGETTAHWQGLLGAENVIETDGSGTGLAHTMAVQIGIREDLMTAQTALEHLVDIGVDKPTILGVANSFKVDTTNLFPEDISAKEEGGLVRE